MLRTPQKYTLDTISSPKAPTGSDKSADSLCGRGCGQGTEADTGVISNSTMNMVPKKCLQRAMLV